MKLPVRGLAYLGRDIFQTGFGGVYLGGELSKPLIDECCLYYLFI